MYDNTMLNSRRAKNEADYESIALTPCALLLCRCRISAVVCVLLAGWLLSAAGAAAGASVTESAGTKRHTSCATTHTAQHALHRVRHVLKLYGGCHKGSCALNACHCCQLYVLVA
jgi:hypothetical protein